MDKYSLLLCASLLSLLPASQCDVTVVSAPAGRFQGEVKSDTEGHSYVAFRGIPFAKPPVGPRRFAKPEPLDKLGGCFTCTY